MLLTASVFWVGLPLALATYLLAVALHRRLFHPLAKVPGPLLPAITTLYQTYYNGKYYLEIARMHEKYGPIVRITPNEVHLSDPGDYDKIYYMGSRFSKSPEFYGAFCIPYSSFSAASNELHKHRRGMLNPMFSRKMVLEFEDVVQEKASKVLRLTAEAVRQKKPVDLHHVFRSVSVDVVTEYAMGKSYNLLDTPDLGAHFFAMVRGVGPAMWAFQQSLTLQALAMKIPPWLAPWVSAPLAQVAKLQQECLRQVEEVQLKMKTGKLDNTRPTIFSELLTPENSDGWPVPTPMQLKDECYSLLAAAADTTGNTLSTAAYHTMANPEIYAKLREELISAFPDENAPLTFVDLEKLPYLTGVIKEGLRLSFGVPGRLPRVTPEPGATFQGHYIPPGTIVGMSSWQMHRDEKVFPDPMRFEPLRWVDEEKAKACSQRLVAFGKGTRQCIGMPLAYCELYLTLGTFFRRFGNLEVFETTPEDLEFEDFFSSYHIAGRKWFKAIGK